MLTSNAQHHCSGGSCAVCERIRVVVALDALLDRIIATAAVTLIGIMSLFIVAETLATAAINADKSVTLVRMKVRINN